MGRRISRRDFLNGVAVGIGALGGAGLTELASGAAGAVHEGRTPVERLGRYLTLSNPRIEELLKASPGALRYRVSVRAGGKEIPFDLIIEEGGSAVTNETYATAKATRIG